MQTIGRARAPLAVLSMATLMAIAGPKGPAPADAAAPSSEGPAVDPKARESLDRSVGYLRTLEAFTVHAETSREEVVSRNFKLLRNEEVDATVKKPDRLRADVMGDEGSRTFVYDGKSLALHVRPENYVATAVAPPTTLEMLDAMLDKYGVELPLLDVLYVASGGDLASNVTEAGYIGTSRVGGVECEHLAFRAPKTDWQVWIDRGERPLPRKVVVTTRGDALAPHFTALFRWNVSPVIDDKIFHFSPPTGSQPIPFTPVRDSAARPRPPSAPKNR